MSPADVTLKGRCVKFMPQLLMALSLACTLAACTESNFSGGTSGKEKDDGEGGQTDLTPITSSPGEVPGGGPAGSGSGSDCINGDKIDLQYTGEVKSCQDQGKVYNFEAKTCTAMRQASFSCDFDSFFSELARIGLQPSKLLTNGKNGVYVDASGVETPRKALIIGCGESADRETILLQWFFQPEQANVSCDFDPTKSSGMIITGCYGKASGPANVSEEEKMKIVLACMNDL